MSISIRLDGREFELPDTDIPAAKFRAETGLQDEWSLFRVTAGGLVAVSARERLKLAEGDNFVSTRRSGGGGFFTFNANTLAALLAVVLSSFSLWTSSSFNHATTEHDEIKSVYTYWLEVGKLLVAVPETTHVFVTPPLYEKTRQQVHLAVSELSPPQKTVLMLKERAMADYVFTLFESLLADYDSAFRFGDAERRRFEGRTLKYLTGSLLRNPRLLWYWDKAGGGLSQEYAGRTQKYYDERVLHDPANPLKETPDADGPLR